MTNQLDPDFNLQQIDSPESTEVERDEESSAFLPSSNVLDDSSPFLLESDFVAEIDGSIVTHQVVAEVESVALRRRRDRKRKREITDDHEAVLTPGSSPIPIPPPIAAPIDLPLVPLTSPAVQFELAKGEIASSLDDPQSPTQFSALPSHVRFNNKPEEFVRVCFSNRGFNKVITQVGVDAETPDAPGILNVARLLSDLIFTNTPANGFDSLKEFFGVDYIGYIIDKERLDKETGEWIRTDEYKIVGAEASSFKDSRVAYGHCYRYRIKSVIKATLKHKKVLSSNLEFLENLRRFEQDRIKEQLKIKRDAIALSEQITNIGILGKSSFGKGARSLFSFSNLLRSDDSVSQQQIDRGGPQVFNLNLSPSVKLTADERQTDIVSIPLSDPRATIRNMRRSQQLKVVDGALIEGTISQTNLQKLINDNLRRFQEELIEYRSFYYESYPSNNWIYVETSEDVPPPPPESIKIVPNTLKRQIMVTWLMPANTQRDIGGKKGGFRLYRRNYVGQRWRLVGSFAENENIYIDRRVRLNRKYIYALSSVDAHGFESFLSTQIQAELNSNYDIEQKEKPLKWVSGSGTTPKEKNVVLKRFTERPPPIIAKRKVFIRPTREFNDVKKNLIIRVTSLDTHEQKEFKVDLNNINVRGLES